MTGYHLCVVFNLCYGTAKVGGSYAPATTDTVVDRTGRESDRRYVAHEGVVLVRRQWGKRGDGRPEDECEVQGGLYGEEVLLTELPRKGRGRGWFGPVLRSGLRSVTGP